MLVILQKTAVPALVLFGAMTAAPLIIALDVRNISILFGPELDYTAASVPALRHWGLMVGSLGLLMILAAFLPQIRCVTVLFCCIEKAFIGYLYFSNMNEMWSSAYRTAAFVDTAIALWGVLYLCSLWASTRR